MRAKPETLEKVVASYSNHASFLAADIPAHISVVNVNGLLLRRSAGGPIGPTADGGYWLEAGPRDLLHPQLFGDWVLRTDVTAVYDLWRDHLQSAQGLSLIPGRPVTVDGREYDVSGPCLVFDDGYSVERFIDFMDLAERGGLAALAATPDTEGNSPDPRFPVSAYLFTRGGNRGACIRANLLNSSQDLTFGGIAGLNVVASANAGSGATSAVHAKLRHTSGESSAHSVEIVTFADVGKVAGMLVRNVTATATETDTDGAVPGMTSDLAGFALEGEVDVDPMGGFAVGFEVRSGAMRADATSFRATASAQRHLHVSAPASVADIHLGANSLTGIMFSGQYGNAAIEVTGGQRIVLGRDGSGDPLTVHYDDVTDEIAFYRGATRIGGFS